MRRIPLTLTTLALAATLAAASGVHPALAQVTPANPPPAAPVPMVMPLVPTTPMTSDAAPALTPPPPHTRPMPPRPGRPVPQHRAGTPMGQPPMGHPPMGHAPMPAGGAPMMDGRPQVPTPAQPFSNLSLPGQSVGDGAYNGGGVVLEYLPDGTRREVR